MINAEMISAEGAVIGSILNSPDLIGGCILTANDFIKYGFIYAAMQDMEYIDLITVDKALHGKHTALLTEIMSSFVTTANFNYYVRIVKQESQRRDLTKLGHELIHIEEANIDELLTETVKRVAGIYEVIGEVPYVQVGEVAGQVATALLEQKPTERGISTYLSKLDWNVGCIEKGDFWVIAGRPGMGKTAMALSMAYQQAKNGYRVGFITMDMECDKITRRLLCHEHDANLSNLIKNRGTVCDMRGVTHGAQVLSELPIFIADKGSVTIRNIDNWITRMVKKDKVDIIYIDYLQQIKAPSDTREQEVATASRAIKALCKDLKVPIVALAQLNRALELRPNKRPKLSDLRESGQLEQDANVILFPYRDEVYNKNSKDEGTVEIIFGKTRDSGAVGNYTRVAFIKESMRFADLYND